MYDDKELHDEYNKSKQVVKLTNYLGKFLFLLFNS